MALMKRKKRMRSVLVFDLSVSSVKSVSSVVLPLLLGCGCNALVLMSHEPDFIGCQSIRWNSTLSRPRKRLIVG